MATTKDFAAMLLFVSWWIDGPSWFSKLHYMHCWDCTSWYIRPCGRIFDVLLLYRWDLLNRWSEFVQLSARWVLRAKRGNCLHIRTGWHICPVRWILYLFHLLCGKLFDRWSVVVYYMSIGINFNSWSQF
eukprot:gene33189-40952_t